MRFLFMECLPFAMSPDLAASISREPSYRQEKECDRLAPLLTEKPTDTHLAVRLTNETQTNA